MQMEKKYFRAKEASVYLGVGLSTIWLMVRQGKLTSRKLSEKVTVFSKQDLDKLAGSVKNG